MDGWIVLSERDAKKIRAKRRSSNIASGGRYPPQTKSARELRQGESDYRCCIPALAGFVSSQSIAPDGEKISSQDRHRAIAFSKHRTVVYAAKPAVTGLYSAELRLQTWLTADGASDSIMRVKWVALMGLILLQCSCTTPVTRRDLYSPEPGPDSFEARRQLAGTTTTTTTPTRAYPTQRDEGLPLSAPQFR